MKAVASGEETNCGDPFGFTLIEFLRRSSVLLLLCMALFTEQALGQSLSVSRKGAGEYWIEATAPADTPYVLQASGNLHLWVDLQDGVSGPLSYRFDNAGVTNRYFRLAPSTPPAPDITVVLIGDSTVADLASNNGWFNGWGQGIYGYFKPGVRVVNLAWPGLSTKWFLGSEQKTQMLAIRPDVVLVQFGRVDDEVPSTDPMAVTFQEYSDNLKTIVQIIRGFDGTPILVTPPVARIFDAQGKVYTIPTFEQRCAIMKDVATETQTPLIDLNQMSIDLFNQLGDNGSAYISYPGNLAHYSAQGAQVIAQLVVNALPDSLGTYLQGIFDPPPKP